LSAAILNSSNSFLQPIAADMGAVDSLIRQDLHSDVALVNQVAEYIIAAGGKRIRPALVLLLARAFGYTGSYHYTLAATIEFIHTSTLLHDDVVDESDLRRGQKTANALFGNAASVLVGDFLYTRAFQLMVSVNDMRVMQVMADATNVIAEGEVMQLMNVREPDLSEESYLQVIHAKTAKLFEAAACLGALVSSASDRDVEAAAAYGRAMGTAFQLIDDVLDYTGNVNETGKNIGNDLREGKVTLPLIHLMRNGTASQRQLVRDCIVDGNMAQLGAILEAVTQSGGLEYTRKMAEASAESAKKAILHFPHSQFKDSLIQLCSFAAYRNF